jgi:hypothetical protein
VPTCTTNKTKSPKGEKMFKTRRIRQIAAVATLAVGQIPDLIVKGLAILVAVDSDVRRKQAQT